MQHDIQSLRLFAAACELGSITRAAAKLHLAVSAASRRVRLLEHEARSQLLVRRAQGIEPTAAGAIMLRYAKDLIRLSDDASSRLDEHRSGVRGFIRVSASSSVLVQRLGADLDCFMKQNPGVKVDLAERPSALVIEAVRRREADLGVIVRGVDTSGLRSFGYGGDRLCVAVPEHHPLGGRRRLRLEEVLDHELVSLEAASETYRLMQQGARELGKLMRVRVHARSFEVVCVMISQGLGIGILPHGASAPLASSLGLRLVALDEPWAARTFDVCIAQAGLQDAAAERLAALLASQYPPAERAGSAFHVPRRLSRKPGEAAAQAVPGA